MKELALTMTGGGRVYVRKQGHYLAVVKISLRKCNLVKENLELETKTQMPSLQGPE